MARCMDGYCPQSMRIVAMGVNIVMPDMFLRLHQSASKCAVARGHGGPSTRCLHWHAKFSLPDMFGSAANGRMSSKHSSMTKVMTERRCCMVHLGWPPPHCVLLDALL